MEESDKEAEEFLEKAWKETKLPVKDSRDVLAAEEKLKRTTELLHGLIGIFDPTQRMLPSLPIADLSSLIKSTNDTLQKIIKLQDAVDNDSAKGIVSTAGKVVQRICAKVTPFMKVFLSVAVRGSAVHPRMSSALPSDTNPQSLRLVM